MAEKMLIIEGKPFGKQRPRVTVSGKYAHAYTPAETKAYEELVKAEYIKQCSGKFDKNIPISLSIVALFEPPKSDSKKKRTQKINNEIYATRKPDWDNIGKVICDALNGVAWVDDSQIVSASVAKIYSEENKVIVFIKELGDSDANV